MANNLEIEAQRQALVTSIRDAAQALRECANKTDTFANYLQNVFPVPQPYPGGSFPVTLASAPLAPPAAVLADGPPAKRKPGRPKKTDHDEDAAAADDGALNGDGKKRKRQTREKKPKDPNAPKRPPSAYLLYQNQVRKEVQAQNPNVPYGEILSIISKAWGQLSDHDKAPYTQATDIAKVEYEKKKNVYEAGLKSADAVKSPENAASVPTHQDTSEDESEQLVPVLAATTTAVPIRSPPVVRPSLAARVQLVQVDEETSEDAEDDEPSGEDDEDVSPPKKRARKSEHLPPPPPPVVTKEKEKEKVKKEKERKGGKEKKHRE